MEDETVKQQDDIAEAMGRVVIMYLFAKEWNHKGAIDSENMHPGDFDRY